MAIYENGIRVNSTWESVIDSRFINFCLGMLYASLPDWQYPLASGATWHEKKYYLLQNKNALPPVPSRSGQQRLEFGDYFAFFKENSIDLSKQVWLKQGRAVAYAYLHIILNSPFFIQRFNIDSSGFLDSTEGRMDWLQSYFDWVCGYNTQLRYSATEELQVIQNCYKGIINNSRLRLGDNFNELSTDEDRDWLLSKVNRLGAKIPYKLANMLQSVMDMAELEIFIQGVVDCCLFGSGEEFARQLKQYLANRKYRQRQKQEHKKPFNTQMDKKTEKYLKELSRHYRMNKEDIFAVIVKDAHDKMKN